MSTPTPTPLNGQLIGQTHYATRALLNRELNRLGIDFETSVALNLTAGGETRPTEAELASLMADALKTDTTATRSIIENALKEGLLERDADAEPRLRLTPTGTEVREGVATVMAPVIARLYGDLPEADLAAAARVLAAVRSRANAELAAG